MKKIRSGRENGNAYAKKIMMVLSPAKTLDLSPFSPSSSKTTTTTITTTVPTCCGNASKTSAIAATMKTKSASELMQLLGISKSLAATASQYWNDFEMMNDDDDDDNNDNKISAAKAKAAVGKPCVFCFSGPAFQGLSASTCTEEQLQYLQERLRIVDPLYGLLRPMDVIQPYRLEMGMKGFRLNNNENDSAVVVKLADYWKSDVTTSLLDDLLGEDREESSEHNNKNNNNVLLNLASDEYSAAVDQSQFGDGRFVKVVFRENGRVVSVHAKRARGLMVHYAAKTQASTLDEIRQFQDEGYKLVESESDNSTLVFDRNKNWKTESSISTSDGAAVKRAAVTKKKNSQPESEDQAQTSKRRRRTRASS